MTGFMLQDIYKLLGASPYKGKMATKDPERCPECKTELVEAVGIAIYCPNDDCPVFDDSDLWDGHGNRLPSLLRKQVE